MTSRIDESKPVEGNALTANVRGNFATAKGEITSLQTDKANKELDNVSSTLTAEQKAAVRGKLDAAHTGDLSLIHI